MPVTTAAAAGSGRRRLLRHVARWGGSGSDGHIPAVVCNVLRPASSDPHAGAPLARFSVRDASRPGYSQAARINPAR